MPLTTTLIVIIGIIAFGMSIFAIYMVQKLIREMKAEEKEYNDEKAKEVKKTYDFLSEKAKVREDMKKTYGEVELEV